MVRKRQGALTEPTEDIKAQEYGEIRAGAYSFSLDEKLAFARARRRLRALRWGLHSFQCWLVQT